ncbi:MAG: hypothetical protein HY273_10720 [Gammaproteobacteria bacterium]|nr:hypothetical protein [Gammaproteobacteria bacterium]
MNTTTANTLLLTCGLLGSTAGMALDTAPTQLPALTVATESSKNEAHTWVDAGAGCLGGAALGTVLPGIGNIIGCAAGAASVWWVRRTPTR